MRRGLVLCLAGLAHLVGMAVVHAQKVQTSQKEDASFIPLIAGPQSGTARSVSIGRSSFLFHCEHVTELARAGYESVHELMAAAVDDNNVRGGMVVSIQTFSDSLKWNP